MGWVRVDDSFSEHPKMVRIGPLGWGVWLAGLAYCNRNLTDGLIPWEVAQRLVCTQIVDDDGRLIDLCVACGIDGEDITMPWLIDLLVSAGVWEVVREGPRIVGYRVHDYGEYQPSKADVLRERKRTAKRQATFRQRHKDSNGNRNAVTNAPVTLAPTPRTADGVSSDKRKSEETPVAPKSNGKGRTTWLTPFWDAWQARYGGEPNAGQLAKELGRLKKDHPEDEMLTAWTAYLAATDAQYATASRFRQTYGSWLNGNGAAGNGRPDLDTLVSLCRGLLDRADRTGLLYGQRDRVFGELEAAHPKLWADAGALFRRLRFRALVEETEGWKVDKELRHQLTALEHER